MMPGTLRIAAMFDMFGPYHLARLNALGANCALLGIEVASRSAVYQWDPIHSTTAFERKTLFDNGDSAQANYRSIAGKVDAALRDFRPNVVLAPGWATKPAIALLQWAIANRIPAVIMSESTRWDVARSALKEALKREIVSCFGAGFVGGSPQKTYLASLGLPQSRIFLGYDAINNSHFAEGAAAARTDALRLRRELGLPECFFLASARFIPIKNLIGLLHAFARFAGKRPNTEIGLVLLGDGPLRTEIEKTRAHLGLEDRVVLPGFRQYTELPAYYGLAEAFVHLSRIEPWGLVVNEAMSAGLPVVVSRECGCAEDLVRDGENGFVVSHDDLDGIAECFATLADCPLAARTEMGERSREIVADWSPERFASGVRAAAGTAIDVGPANIGPARRALLGAVARII